MEIQVSDLTAPQGQALLDLLVLAMYLDQHLGSAEDERVKRLLTAMGCATPYDRQRQFDASVTRVRNYAETPDLARALATRLARAFTTQDQCRRVYALLEDLITCDGQIAPQESRLLELLRDSFQV